MLWDKKYIFIFRDWGDIKPEPGKTQKGIHHKKSYHVDQP